ncbi:MAG: BREX-1 system adenine-specific DNA-methyltransferase PglX [Eubacterium sp.]|nr:BREX-1 system adenine-specific DNA-methyltransferase PglX [Eubacterium sp.]
MNKTAIKNYAIWARVNLIEAAKQRAYQYEITKEKITDAGADIVAGKPLTKDEKEQRRQLIDQIKLKGFDQVMEEVAFTWFNRFIALRFMEVNGYLPTKIRVFTDAEGNFKPEILKEALTVELSLDKARVMELLEKQENEELYKMLLIAQCNELSSGLPNMFEVISNYTELLFPNNLLKEDSILGEMVNSIPEEDWTDEVQIIGWLYQYYNSELKDETFALLKKNVKISKERIPAATQLFTPDWIVRYMVENSLGRLWYEGHPNDEIKKDWKYYLDEAQQEPEVEEQLKKLREEYKSIKPEDIKVIDPCMGSGHILVYAFDVLMQIYTSAGWSERDAAESILENNLFGLDIDDRAGQLAYFAVMMKARKFNRKILTKNIRPKVYSIMESNNVKIEAWQRLGPEEYIARKLVQDFTDAKEYGSALNPSVTTAELQALRKRLDDIDEMSTEGNLLDVIQSDEITRQLYPLVELAEVMLLKYDVVVTNPPYMGNGGMSGNLSEFVKKYYPDSKSDLFAVFIEKCRLLSKQLAFQAMITQHAWMFLSSFEDLRKEVLSNDIINMVHLGARAFDEIGGEVVQTTSFVLRKAQIKDYSSTYCRLLNAPSQDEKEKEYLSGRNRFTSKNDNYTSISGSPIAYWVSNSLLEAFRESPMLSSICEPKQGLITGDNNTFLRLWFEVNNCNVAFQYSPSKKWYPINKGGEFKRWYGNRDYILNWENDGKEIKNFKDEKGKLRSRPQNLDYNFRSALSWSLITTTGFSVRLFDSNFAFNVAGISCFPDESIQSYLLALLNSKIVDEITKIINPTLNMNVGDVARVPIKIDEQQKTIVDQLSNESVELCKADWDSYETSWDFKKNPLI